MDYKDICLDAQFDISQSQALNHNVLVFAFVGDAVFTLFVRNYLATTSTKKAGILHAETSNFVKASYQSKLMDMMAENLLNGKELQISKTARNIKTHNVAKNSNLEEYKNATSFEAVLGYLYLTHQSERLNEILDFCKNQIIYDTI